MTSVSWRRLGVQTTAWTPGHRFAAGGSVALRGQVATPGHKLVVTVRWQECYQHLGSGGQAREGAAKLSTASWPAPHISNAGGSPRAAEMLGREGGEARRDSPRGSVQGGQGSVLPFHSWRN